MPCRRSWVRVPSSAPPRTAPRLGVTVLLVVCVFFVVYGAKLAWQNLVTLPRTYDRLRAHGTNANARLIGCPPVHGRCELQLTSRGRTRTWRFGENRRQFSGVSAGSTVQMLLDSRHPTTAYTVTDVDQQTNAGWSPSAIYGFVLVAIGAAGGYGLTRFGLLVRRTYLPGGQ